MSFWDLQVSTVVDQSQYLEHTDVDRGIDPSGEDIALAGFHTQSPPATPAHQSARRVLSFTSVDKPDPSPTRSDTAANAPGDRDPPKVAGSKPAGSDATELTDYLESPTSADGTGTARAVEKTDLCHDHWEPPTVSKAPHKPPKPKLHRNRSSQPAPQPMATRRSLRLREHSMEPFTDAHTEDGGSSLPSPRGETPFPAGKPHGTPAVKDLRPQSPVMKQAQLYRRAMSPRNPSIEADYSKKENQEKH